MRWTLTITMIVALSASMAFSQEVKTPVEPQKPETKTEASVAASKPEIKAEAAPVLDTKKLWMLLAKDQSMHLQLNASPLGRAIAKADEAVAEEQGRLGLKCTGKWMPGEGEDGDFVCVARPTPPPPPAMPQPTPPPVAPSPVKGK